MHRDLAQAVENLGKWGCRAEWAELRQDVFEDHFGGACDRFDVDLDELLEEIGQVYTSMVLGVLFEDFASRRFPPGDRNVVDDYLSRRGWKETPRARRYLEQVRDSTLSLYEVVGVSRGEHVDVRDMIRRGDTVRVLEQSGSQALVQWDQIAARVIDMDGEKRFAGGILQYEPESADEMRGILEGAMRRSGKKLEQARAPELDFGADISDLPTAILEVSAPVFAEVWLTHLLQRLRAPIPELVNMSGEELLFCEARWKIRERVRADVEMRLDEVLAWLKQLERHEARQARDGQLAYESDWIWKELGIERPVLTISGT